MEVWQAAVVAGVTILLREGIPAINSFINNRATLSRAAYADKYGELRDLIDRQTKEIDENRKRCDEEIAELRGRYDKILQDHATCREQFARAEERIRRLEYMCRTAGMDFGSAWGAANPDSTPRPDSK